MLALTYVLPAAPLRNSPHAGGQFCFNYIEAVAAAGNRVTILAPGDTRYTLKCQAKGLLPAGVEVVVHPPAPGLGERLPGRRVSRALRPLALRPWSARTFLRIPELRNAIEGADLVELHWTHMLQLVPAIRQIAPNLPVVAFQYNLASLAVGAADSPGLHKRLVRAIRASRARRVEARLCNLVDTVLTFSTADQAELRRLGVTTPMHRVDPFVSRCEPLNLAAGDPVVLFVAAFGRAPNAEGAAWFLEHVWPAVARDCRDARLVLAGAGPGDELLRRASASPRVEITGHMSDLGEAYRQARVVIAPVFGKGGLKFKVPQAMAYGLPVVATADAATGVIEASGHECFAGVTDDPGAFAQATIRCLRDVAWATEIGNRGWDWVRRAYSFENTIGEVNSLYRDLCSRRG